MTFSITAPDRSNILTIMKSKIWTEECRTLWHEGYYIFDIINDRPGTKR